jgi:hypothetical protein
VSMERRLNAIEGSLGVNKAPAAEVIVYPVGEVPSSEPEQSAYFGRLRAARPGVQAIILLPDNGRGDRALGRGA